MLQRADGRPLAIGHRGAAALAPENTLASLRAAVEAGADVVEFDVLREAGGELVLAHSARETPAERLSLDDALAWLRDAGCGVHVDVKGVGFEAEVAAAIGRHALAARALVSTSRPPSVRRFGLVAPGLPRALSYPEDRLGVSRSPLAQPLVAGGLAALRRALPARIAGMLRRADATVASLHHALVTRRLVERCHALGVPVVAWTVDDPRRVAELADAGIDAIVADDPRALVATLRP